jgi:hypothetical protein
MLPCDTLELYMFLCTRATSHHAEFLQIENTRGARLDERQALKREE